MSTEAPEPGRVCDVDADPEAAYDAAADAVAEMLDYLAMAIASLVVAA